MAAVQSILSRMINECNAARACFQVWWGIRSSGRKDFVDTMNHGDHVLFFVALQPALYREFLLATSKLFDRDDRSVGFQALREALAEEDRSDLAKTVSCAFTGKINAIKAIVNIRSKSLAHMQLDIGVDDIYEEISVCYDDVRELIDEAADVLNLVADETGFANKVSKKDLFEKATLSMLRFLKAGIVRSNLGS